MGSAHTRAQNKYIKSKYDRIGLVIRKDGGDGCTVEQIKAAAAREGVSVNAWIIDAIRDRI